MSWKSNILRLVMNFGGVLYLFPKEGYIRQRVEQFLKDVDQGDSSTEAATKRSPLLVLLIGFMFLLLVIYLIKLLIKLFKR